MTDLEFNIKDLKEAIVFAILMKGDIFHFHPKYVLEKYYLVKRTEQPENLLDSFNLGLLKCYFEKWEKGER